MRSKGIHTIVETSLSIQNTTEEQVRPRHALWPTVEALP